MTFDPSMPAGLPERAKRRERFTVLSIAGVWTLYLMLVALRTSVIEFPHRAILLERHGATAAVGALLTWCLHLALRPFAPRSVRVRIGACVLLAVVPAFLLAILNYNIMFVFDPQALWSDSYRARMSLTVVMAQTITENYFLFAAWATLASAFDSAGREADALNRAALSAVSAREAQLLALRYQLDPHFIFNALNTVSALVIAGDADGAERTIDALAGFLRETLSIDATEDVPLERELLLQRRYLQVQQVRFGERLSFELDLPEVTRTALVPALLLQPLVENVIRHGVARVEGPVRMTVRVRRDGDLLRLMVEDDAPGPLETDGRGVGLRNVGARLATRFGARGQCRYGPCPGGGYRVDLSLPFRTAA